MLPKLSQDDPGASLSNLDTGRQAAQRLDWDAVVPQAFDHAILRNESAIEALSPRITSLLCQTGQAMDVTLEPGYFLEQNVFRSAPAVVLIGGYEQVDAVLYGRERRLLGIRTGVVECGDHYGDSTLIAREDFRTVAAAVSVVKLLELPGIHTVRVSLKIEDDNEIATIDRMMHRAGVRSRMLSEVVQHNLVLEDTFDGFLNKLGSHTRRNLRVYRRKVEQMGWRFHPRLGPADVAAAFRILERRQGRHRRSAHFINCYRSALTKLPGSFCAGLCTATGEWVSLVGGWLRDDRYLMLLQLNDNRYLRDSVSTVMRSYLVEELIGSRVALMSFIGGSSEPLRRYCIPQRCAHYLFEKRGVLSAGRRFAGALFFGKSLVSRIHRGEI